MMAVTYLEGYSSRPKNFPLRRWRLPRRREELTRLASGSSDTGPVFGLLSGCIYVSIILYRTGTDEAQGSRGEENQEKE